MHSGMGKRAEKTQRNGRRKNGKKNEKGYKNHNALASKFARPKIMPSIAPPNSYAATLLVPRR